MTVTVNPPEAQAGALVIKLTGAASTANGGLGAVANPEGVDVLILRTQLLITTPSTGGANLSAGVASAANGAATDIINVLAMNGAITGKVYNGSTIQATAKTEIAAPAIWQDDYYITFTGSATTAGLEAYLFVEYLRLP